MEPLPPEAFGTQQADQDCPARSLTEDVFADMLALMIAVHETLIAPPEVAAEIAHRWLHRRLEKTQIPNLQDHLQFFYAQIAAKPLGQVLCEMSAGARLAIEEDEAEWNAQTPSENREEELIQQGQRLLAMQQVIRDTGFDQ